MHRIRVRLTVVILAALLGSLFLTTSPLIAHATVTCTNGVSRLATASDVPIMTAAGIPNAAVGTEYCPDDLNTGAAAGQAKVYLRSVLCPPDGDNYGGSGPDGTIQGLDAKFAECAASLLKQLNSSGGGYCIREGKRTVAKQNEYVARGVLACKRGAMCEHPRGIALDINSKTGNKSSCSSYTQAHQLAPQFGLTFYLGCKDAYHVVPQKYGCSAGGTAPVDGSGGTTNPNSSLPASYYDYPQYAPAGAPQSANPFATALSALSPILSQQTTPSQTTTQSSVPTSQGNVTPQPTGTTNTYNAPDPYTTVNPTTTHSQTTTSSGERSSSAYEQILMNAAGTNITNSTGQSVQTSQQPGSTQLNSNLGDSTSIGDSSSFNTGAGSNGSGGADNGTGTGSGSNTQNGTTNIGPVTGTLALGETRTDMIASTSVPISQVRVTDTFGESVPTIQATSGLNADQSKSLIIALLTALRDFLLNYLNFLKSRSTYGFQGAWQMPASAPVYR